MKNGHYRIGIDPDVEKSGFALISRMPFGKPQILSLNNLHFFDLLDKILAVRIESQKESKGLYVFVEAGWLNKKSQFREVASRQISENIAKKVGQNEAIGQKFVEFCIREGIEVRLYRPKSEKWDAKLFRMVTGFSDRTNQEQRDAVRACW